MQKVIITAPSLDPTQNVSGVSSVVQFIIDNNKGCEYSHFELGKKDKEKRGIGNVTRILKCYKKWKCIINTNKDAIVHYSFPLSAPSILRDPWFMWYALKNGVKMVVHLHGGVFLTAPKIPFFLMKILKWVFSWDIPFIVLSDSEKETLTTRFGAKNVVVIPNCPAPALSVHIPSEKDPLRFGYLGRIEVNKGMNELLEACKKLKADNIPFELVFAGKEVHEGEYIPVYQKELGDSFKYVGLVSGKSKADFLGNLDVFVMPTYFEGLPMSLLETMSYGTVPVVTPVGSIPKVVNSISFSNTEDVLEKNGAFIKVKDVDSIVDTIKFLHNDREALRILGKNARKTIDDNFSTARYVENLNSIYASL